MSKNNNRHGNQNQKPKVAEDASQEEVQETTTEASGETTVDSPASEPTLSPEGEVDTEEQDETIEETDEDEDEPTETTEQAPKPTPRATVSSHLPSQRTSVAVGDYSQAHVDSVIKPAKRFIELAKDPETPINKFNDAKSIMYTALLSAIRYPDASNFIATMSQFLALVKENRDTAFHELEFNKYSHALTLSATACRDLPRVMCVFMTLASDSSKDIGKIIDFKSVFTGGMNEAHIERFRNWALRSA